MKMTQQHTWIAKHSSMLGWKRHNSIQKLHAASEGSYSCHLSSLGLTLMLVILQDKIKA